MAVETLQVQPEAPGDSLFYFLFSFLLIFPVFIALAIRILQLSSKHFLSQGGR
jgi:hypothetical protein